MVTFEQIRERLYESLIAEGPITNTVIATSKGAIPAAIKLKGGSKPEITKLVSKINALKNVLFVRQFQDNGIAAAITIGRKDKPSAKYIIQRIANPAVSLRANDVNAQVFADPQGNKAGVAIALVEITTNNATVIDNRKIVSTLQKYNKNLKPNMAAGINITSDNVDTIIQTLVLISKQTSPTAIINAWATLITPQDD